MRAAVLYGPLDLKMENVLIPKIRKNEILVKIKRVGICGSDVHFYQKGRIADFVVEKPIILGHECSGKVQEIGSDVTRMDVGERVVIEPGFVCGKCPYCRGGRYNLCSSVRFYGTPPVDGAFAEYVVAPERNVFPMPTKMSYKTGAMIEPLAVGLMAADMGCVEIGNTVAILGAGPIGQMILQATKTRGVIETYMTDLIDYRLKHAKINGAKDTFNPSRDNICEKFMELTDNKGVDVVIEASGSPKAVQQTLQIVKRGGRIVLVGHFTEEITLPVEKIVSKQLNVKGIHRYANMFPAAIKAVSYGQANVESCVTHSFPLERIKDGLKTLINKINNPLKVQIFI